MINVKQGGIKYYFSVFGMTRPGIETRSPGPLANILLIWPMARFLRSMARLNNIKSWRQHPIKQQLYGHLSPISKTIKVRLTRHAGHCWRSRDELIRDIFLWTPLWVLLSYDLVPHLSKKLSKFPYSCGHLYMNEQRQDERRQDV